MHDLSYCSHNRIMCTYSFSLSIIIFSIDCDFWFAIFI
nr:MAG TPA: hypothetical protein [Caudoviricetes sp.]